jgi:hypothetical protein
MTWELLGECSVLAVQVKFWWQMPEARESLLEELDLLKCLESST